MFILALNWVHCEHGWFSLECIEQAGVCMGQRSAIKASHTVGTTKTKTIQRTMASWLESTAEDAGGAVHSYLGCFEWTEVKD